MSFRYFKIFFLCQCTFLVIAFSDTTDIFPLKTGLHCIYNYEHEYYYWNYSYYSYTTDSGTVEYSVLDSVNVGDTTVIWHVREIKQILHRVLTYPDYDTTFFISDSLTFQLTESTNGYHELQSVSLIWRFPLLLQIGDIIDYTTVYRYADTSYLLLSKNAKYCMIFPPPIAINTALFRRDSGLTQLQIYDCSDYDETGSYDFTTVQIISRTITSVPEITLRLMQPKLSQNYPNPLNNGTIIQYQIPKAGWVTLKVYNTLGQEIATLVNQYESPGLKSCQWDAMDIASGVYMYRLVAGGYSETRKMVLIK